MTTEKKRTKQQRVIKEPSAQKRSAFSGGDATEDATVEGTDAAPESVSGQFEAESTAKAHACEVTFRRDPETGRMQIVKEGKCSPDDIAQVRQAAAELNLEGEHSDAKEESTQPAPGLEGEEARPIGHALEKDGGDEGLSPDGTDDSDEKDLAEESVPQQGGEAQPSSTQEQARLEFSLIIGEDGVPVLSSDDKCDPVLAEEVIKLLREQGAIYRPQEQELGDPGADEEGAELKKVTTTTTTKRMYERAPSAAGGPKVPAVTMKQETVGRKTKGR